MPSTKLSPNRRGGVGLGPSAMPAAAGAFVSDGPSPQHDELGELLDQPSPYPVRPVRPLRRAALRAGLWGAVVLGATSGVAALLVAPGTGAPAEDAGVVDEDTAIPATVAGTAEIAVHEWLLATEGTAARVDPLFVEAPALPRDGTVDGREVLAARAVSGERVVDGYWAVTVAVDLVDGRGAPGIEAVDEGGDPVDPGEEDGRDGDGQDGGEAAEAPEAGVQRWYVEVGIVGDEQGALAALRTPAVVPPPRGVAEGWSTHADEVAEPGLDGPEAVTVGDFLRSVLVGEGDSSRYVASGVDIPPMDPPPFAALELTGLTAEELDDGTVRFQVFVDATTASGASQPGAYEVVAEWRDSRLEVLELWGAASLAGRPDRGPGGGAADATDETDAADEESEGSEGSDAGGGG